MLWKDKWSFKSSKSFLSASFRFLTENNQFLYEMKTIERQQDLQKLKIER